ncbi:nuclear transport factor 2 family protein [Vibrio sp. T187]|uniref:nuclear transport factor 2 family protein n=1 Tax=Vibrio TaxID=662 RepID=UPI0010C9F0B9|nr:MULTISPECIES: nuclear transport factor 2 family protein [Vibrio]MBW3696896.1 nuclear transport factor 2 family protein [Vibrio sp. T187]
MKDAFWVERFVQAYSQLGTDNLHLLKDVYHANVVFCDPMHRVEGIWALLDYFDHMYSHVTRCDFDIERVFHDGDQAAVYWTMTYEHERLNGKQPIEVQGHSHIRMKDDRVVFHRDYLDVGAMLYEHIPLIGSVVKTIKRRASQV